MGRSNPPFMTGVPELLCLRLLKDETLYGYELVRRIRLITDEHISLGEGVVYPVLHALERGGALRAKRQVVGGRSRVYYSMTAKGRRRLEVLEGRWHNVRSALDAALTGGA